MRTTPDYLFSKWSRIAIIAVAVTAASAPAAWALIMGGEGNDPIRDPGWPDGAEAVFNTKSRVAYWEGPPFGGGQWHAECRGNTADFQRALDDFAKIDISRKRVILHDGVGRSFWLNPNRDKDKQAQAAIDWVFMVWRPESLKFQQGLPAGVRALGQRDDPLLAQLDIYTGGSIRWTDVKVPEGIEVVDQRLEAHGFSLTDGTVLEGTAFDIATQKPLTGKLILERIEPQQQGGYRYTPLIGVDTDTNGHWVLKNTPAEWCRLVLTAEGYVSRVIGYGQYDEEPQWSEHNAGLSKPGVVTGSVVDDLGQPLAEVEARIDDLEVKDAGRYELPDGATTKTDADGQFKFAAAPLGTASVWVHKPGYVRPGLGQKIKIPSTDLKLEMQPAAKLQVRVDFSATTRPGGYIVHVEPEGGSQVGKWSGSGNISVADEITYENIPAGRYVITGRPNPGSENETTSPVTVELKRGAATEVTITAR